jgi:MFS family permease
VTHAPASRQTGYVELVSHNRSFRLLWFGQIISLLGDWFDFIASAALLTNLTNSGAAIGGLFVVRMLAPFLVSPLAGVAADRFNRKHLLIASDLARAVVVMGFLLVRRPEHVWLLYTITALQLGLSGFYFPARNAILPDIVTRSELGAANALSSATWSVMLAFGAALGGLAAGEWGVYPSFVIDALTFVLSAVLLSRVYYHHAPPLSGSRTLSAALSQYVDGLRYLWHHTDILFVSLHKSASALLASGVFQVIQVALARDVFVLGAGGGTGLGIMFAVVGIGTGVGPIIARRFTEDRNQPLRIAIAISYVISALGFVLIAPLLSFDLTLLGLLLRGIGVGSGWVLSPQLLLPLVPDRVRGRVFATEFALLSLMNAFGALAGGWVLDQTWLSLGEVIYALALVILLPGILWSLWIMFGQRERPPEEAEAVAESAK